MKIANTGPVGTPPARRRDRTAKSDSNFAGEVSNEAPVRPVAPPSEIASVNTLLALQEVGDPTDQKRRAIRRGENLLERLDELRHGLLVGAYPHDKLDGILTLVRNHHDRVTDPRLQEILQEIELRAAVELAKLGKFN
jgi:hypothetical protein